MNEHTPGPWVIGDRNRAGDFYIKPVHGNAGKNYVAIVVSQGDLTLTEIPGDADANAHLIAAAPDLMAALKGVMVSFAGDDLKLASARAAIAKAEGR